MTYIPQALLFHPRVDDWQDHFSLKNGEFLGLTPIGKVTIRFLKLNQPNRVEERKLLFSVS